MQKRLVLVVLFSALLLISMFSFVAAKSNSAESQNIFQKISSWFMSFLGIGREAQLSPGETVSDGLVEYYSFDSIGNDSANYVGGKSGLAYNFAGNNYVATTLNRDFKDDFTVSLWAKPTMKDEYFGVLWSVGDNAGNNPALIQGGGGGYTIDNKLYFLSPDCGSQWFETGYEFTDTSWHNVIVKRSGNEYRFYVDGIQTPNTASASGCGSTSGVFNIGYQKSWLWTGTYYCKDHCQYAAQAGHYYGLIDEVRVYNRALSDSEIQVLAEVTSQNTSIACYQDSDCGISNITKYCNGSSACTTSVSYQCNNPGTPQSSCAGGAGTSCTPCANGCNSGACINTSQPANQTCKGQINHGQVCIELVSPNGDEDLIKGQNYTIRWKQFNVNEVNIYYRTCDSCLDSIARVPVNSTQVEQSYLWSNVRTGYGYNIDNIKIEVDGGRIGGGQDSDVSDNTFKIIDNSTCTDSDGGLNYYVKGTVTGFSLCANSIDGTSYPCNYGTYADQCVYNSKYNTTKLSEGICTLDGFSSSILYDCPNGCSNGTCYWPGYYISYDKENYRIGDYVAATFTSADPGNIVNIDLYLLKNSDTGEVKINLFRSLPIAESYYIAINSSNYAQFFDKTGYYAFLICDAGSACDGSLGGTNSAQFYLDINQINATCTDSDGGLNYYIKGTIDGIEASQPSTPSDFCLDDINLQEYACGENSKGNRWNYNWTDYTCPHGCYDGQCIYGLGELITLNEGDIIRVKSSENVYRKISVVYIGSDGTNTYKARLNIDGIQTSALSVGDQYYLSDGTEIVINDIIYSSKDSADSKVMFVVFPAEGCTNATIRATNFRDENGKQKVTIEEIRDGSWVTVCNDFTTGGVCYIGDAEILIGYIDKYNKQVELTTNGMFYDSVSQQYSKYILYDGNLMDSLDLSLATSCQTNICQDSVSDMRTILGDIVGSYEYNYNFTYHQENYNPLGNVTIYDFTYYDKTNLKWMNVRAISMDDKSKLMSDTSWYKDLIYSIKGSEMWEVKKIGLYVNNLYATKQYYVLGGSYRNQAIAFWPSENSFIFVQSYDSSSQSPSVQDVQKFIDSLKNNQFEYVSLSAAVQSDLHSFIVPIMQSCISLVSESCSPSWAKKMEPVVCPEYGYQNQIISDMNYCAQSREERMQCSPGICSGCYVPRWFSYYNKGQDNICIPYGTRFIFEDGRASQIYQGKVIEELIKETGFDAKFEIRNDGTAYMELYSDVNLLNLSNGEIASADIYFDGSVYHAKAGESLTIYPGYHQVDITYYDAYGNKVFSDGVAFEISRIVYNSNDNTQSYIEVVNRENYPAYCDVDGWVKRQRDKEGSNWAQCQNNYECESNICSYGECVDTKALAQEAAGFKVFVVKVLCKLSNMFDTNAYDQCVIQYSPSS